MSTTWTKDETKQFFIWNNQHMMLLWNNDKNVGVEMEVDCFNGRVCYNVTDGEDITYHTFRNISDAIDLFYEMKEDKNYE